MTRDAGLVQRGDDEVAAQAVFLAHPLHAAGAAFQRLDGRLLRHNRGAENGVLVDFHHRLDDVGGTAGVADAPSGHCEGLGEAVKEERPLLHSGKRGDRVMRHLVVGEFAVDLIGEDDQVMLHGEGSDLLEFLQRQDRPRGVGREVEH